MQNQQGVFPAPTDYQLVAAPVRARIIKIQADRLGQCERLRRAVDCAPYQLSALPRLCVENAEAWSHAALPTQQIFWGSDTSPRRPVGVAVQLLLCYGAQPSWPQVFCDRGRSRSGGRLARGHLGRSARKVGGACQGFFRQ